MDNHLTIVSGEESRHDAIVEGGHRSPSEDDFVSETSQGQAFWLWLLSGHVNLLLMYSCKCNCHKHHRCIDGFC